LQVLTPDELKGRIFAADASLVTLAMSLSLLFAGLISGFVGVSATIAIIGGGSLLWGVVFLFLTRALRADAEAEANTVHPPAVETPLT
jgi:uncharacterized oligopeptide transporter (OPT) family protein